MSTSLLVIRFSAIGDLLLTAPVLQALSNEGTKVDLLVKSHHANWLEALPGVQNILLWEEQQEALSNDYLGSDIGNNEKKVSILEQCIRQ